MVQLVWHEAVDLWTATLKIADDENERAEPDE
jgi:hypothetical protein